MQALKTLAKNVTRLREGRGLSRKDLADRLGVTESFVWRVENEKSWLNQKHVQTLARVFDIEETDLFYPGEPPKAKDHQPEECAKLAYEAALRGIRALGTDKGAEPPTDRAAAIRALLEKDKNPLPVPQPKKKSD